MDKLTPQEEAELRALEAEDAERLTPEEEAELQALEAESSERTPASRPGFFDPASWKASAQQLQADMKDRQKMEESANMAVGAMGMGAIPQIANQAPSALARFLGRTGGEALVGAAQSPDDRMKGAVAGALGSAGGEGVGKALDLAGDITMQMGAKMPKYRPGRGTRMAEQGIWGTENMMENQVRSKLDDAAQNMRRIALEKDAQSLGGIDTTPMGDAIRDRFVRPKKLLSQEPSPLDVPALKESEEYAKTLESLSGNGPMSYADALTQRANEGGRAYSFATGQMKKNLTNELAGEGQALLSKRLKEDLGPQFVAADETYSALAPARRALEAEDSLPRSLFGLLNKGMGAVPMSSLGLSTTGQVASKAAKAAPFAGRVGSRVNNTENSKEKKK